MSPSAAVIEKHLNAAAILEHWLRSYPDWVAQLGEDPGIIKSTLKLGSGGGIGNPAAEEAMRLADMAARAEAIRTGLEQMPEELREVVYLHYFSNVPIRRKLRNAAIAHLLDHVFALGLLTTCSVKGKMG